MTSNNQKKLVLFGFGKIACSFIGQFISRWGFEQVFIDVFQSVINEHRHEKCKAVILEYNY